MPKEIAEHVGDGRASTKLLASMISDEQSVVQAIPPLDVYLTTQTNIQAKKQSLPQENQTGIESLVQMMTSVGQETRDQRLKNCVLIETRQPKKTSRFSNAFKGKDKTTSQVDNKKDALANIKAKNYFV